MSDRIVAVHEVSHAVTGVCLGRLGLLKKVSIIASEHMKGGFHWDISSGKCPPDERDQELGICLAGPIGQVLYAPESFGTYITAFRETIFQPDSVLEKAGCAGWAATDLNQFISFRRHRYPLHLFTEIEAPLRSLLQRPSVCSAIAELASQLEVCGELEGLRAEHIISECLLPSDYVGKDYFS